MKVGYIGILLGAAALLLVLVSFWAGPFSAQPVLEVALLEQVDAVREASAAAWAGQASSAMAGGNIDAAISIIIPTLGSLALILAVVACVKKEPYVFPSGAAALGGSAIAFQFIAMYAMGVLVVLVICVVLSSLISGLSF